MSISPTTTILAGSIARMMPAETDSIVTGSLAGTASSTTSDAADTSPYIASTILSSTDVRSSTTEAVLKPPTIETTLLPITLSAPTPSSTISWLEMTSITPSSVLVFTLSSATSGSDDSVSTDLGTTTTSYLTTSPTNSAINFSTSSDTTHAISLTNVVLSSTMTSTKTTMRISSTGTQARATKPIGWVASTTMVVPMTSQTTLIQSTMVTSGPVSSPSSTSSYTASANGSTLAIYDARHHFTRPEKVVAAVVLPIALTVVAAILALVVWLEHTRRQERRKSIRRHEILSTGTTRASLALQPDILPPGTTSRNFAFPTAPAGPPRSVNTVQCEGGSATGSAVHEPSLAGSSTHNQALDEDYHYILKDL
ncbi:hypothetical protein LTR78_009996 [Recurvomyces mirabilis]|uniref:Uncharacterized protein n=1 Tax=Recurvomyces mirabilis TaxID=574656 RepID=A0AAE0WGC8_9PEZI|nr:hypothetical protein LTR78_009996 [Recurvomyces mirabilis]KAK5160337.1 hypothetical protein LTS14_001349 [Recurvomyces mirabilis]